MRRDPAKAVLMLDLLTEFFDGGRRWLKGNHHDDDGNACLFGALDYIAIADRTDIIAHRSAIWYLARTNERPIFVA